MLCIIRSIGRFSYGRTPLKPATLTGRGFLRLRLGGHMQPANQPTKQDERERLRELAEQRQRQTPEHIDPDWMAAFWLRKAVLS